MKQAYKDISFRDASLRLIEIMDEIATDYESQGFRMTVRQLYYQLVAREIIPNTIQSYNNVQTLLTNARMAGLIDWEVIEDRTRGFTELPHWRSGRDVLHAAANGYHEDMWQDQPCRVFVVVEKEALAGVLEKTCNMYDVPLLAARGYPSVSTLREFAVERLMLHEGYQKGIILHLGDHDPSGIDMTRDLVERLKMLSEGADFSLERLALNMDQIKKQKPPPNPAKTTDSRFGEYERLYGAKSWELDALSPVFLHELVSTAIEQYIDDEKLRAREERVRGIKTKITAIASKFKDE